MVHAHLKQENYTRQTKQLHAANEIPARCKQNSSTLQTKLLHTANKIPPRYKQNNITLQKKKKLSHAVNKGITRCKKASAHCKKAKVLRAG